MRRLVLALAVAGCTAEPSDDPGFTPWLACEADAPATMGDTPLRRLTRGQYDRAVRDLFGVTGYAQLLDQDEYVGTFASNSVTPVSQLVVEQYMLAAEAVARDADLGRLDDCNPYTDDRYACARDFVETWGRRVYRRPLTADEIADYETLYDEFADLGHLDSLRVVVGAMLQSPYFLYHDDYEATDVPPDGELVPLDPYALASRLSFFLWGSIPDDDLLDAAASGTLSTVEGVTAQALRLLADPRAADGIGDFHLQWLGADHLPEVAKDGDLFPEYDRAIVAALQAETAAFADYVIRFDDAELSTLLGADYTVITEPLLDLYGLDAADWTPGEPIGLDGTGRLGILTHGSVLAAHAHYQRSSLTLRGKLIREELLCHGLPDPPPDVDITLPEPSAGETTRDSVEAHMADPSCAGCHELIDPIGFAFENFDAIGQFRALDNGTPVDASGELLSTDVDGAFDGADGLVALLVDSQQVRFCVTRQWFRYALGRQEEPRDACSVLDTHAAFEQPHSLRELILRLVTSPSFRSHRVDG